jgi:hypothetical protein
MDITVSEHVRSILSAGAGTDVEDRLRAKLISDDVQRGYIDFAREQASPIYGPPLQEAGLEALAVCIKSRELHT